MIIIISLVHASVLSAFPQFSGSILRSTGNLRYEVIDLPTGT